MHPDNSLIETADCCLLVPVKGSLAHNICQEILPNHYSDLTGCNGVFVTSGVPEAQ